MNDHAFLVAYVTHGVNGKHMQMRKHGRLLAVSCNVIWHHIALGILGFVVVWKLASNCASSTGRLEASSRDLSAYESLAWSFFNTEAPVGVLLSDFCAAEGW